MELAPVFVSLKLAVSTTIILVLVSLFPGWFFATTKFRFAPFLEAAVSIPLVLPPTVLGFYLLLVFSPAAPFGSFLAQYTGIRLVFSFPGILLASVIAGFPFMLQSVKNGIEAVNPRIVEAALTMGKHPVIVFLKIVVPNIGYAIVSGCITVFARTLGEFGVILMVGGSIPGVTRVLSTAIYEKVEQMDYSAAHLYSGGLLLFSYIAVASVLYLKTHIAKGGNRT